MQSTSQQRLVFDDKYDYARFAPAFAGDDGSCAPIIGPVEVDVVESSASVDCVLRLTAEEVGVNTDKLLFFCIFSPLSSL